MSPLIAVASINTLEFWIAELEVKVSLWVSVVIQLVQNGEQISLWIVRVLTQSISNVIKQSSICVVAENLDKVIF